MAEIPNLTDRIAQLRDFKESKSLQGSRPPYLDRKPAQQNAVKNSGEENEKKTRTPERPVAFSFLVSATYTLLLAALLAQLIIIVLLDFL